jgi:hypothetical protein
MIPWSGRFPDYTFSRVKDREISIAEVRHHNVFHTFTTITVVVATVTDYCGYN